MRKTRVRINLIFFSILFVVLLVEATRSIINVGAITHPYPLSATFTNANGVLTHDEVDYLGVAYGEVSRVTRTPGGVVVHMAIKKGHLIPMGSSANLDLKSAIGEQYINFQPPAAYEGNHGPYYQAGFTLPQSPDPAHPEHGFTSTPVQFSDLLRSASNLLASIPPEALASLVSELATGLNGTTDSLRTLIQSGDRLSSALVTRTQALNQLLTDSTKLVHVVAEHRESLTQAVTDLKAVAAMLQSIQPSTNTLLDKSSPLFQTLANLVATEQANLDCTLKGLNPLLDLVAAPRKQKELTALLDLGPRAFGDAFDSIDIDGGPSGAGLAGPWLRIGLVVNATHPAVMFSQPKAQPPPVAVAACASALRPAAGDYRPANIASHSAPVPSLGEVLVVVGAGLVVLAYLRHRVARAR